MTKIVTLLYSFFMYLVVLCGKVRSKLQFKSKDKTPKTFLFSPAVKAEINNYKNVCTNISAILFVSSRNNVLTGGWIKKSMTALWLLGLATVLSMHLFLIFFAIIFVTLFSDARKFERRPFPPTATHAYSISPSRIPFSLNKLPETKRKATSVSVGRQLVLYWRGQ